MIPLLLGTLLTLAALALVLYPLFDERRRAITPDVRDEDEAGDVAIAALREVEFDRETGKLSAEDYEALKVAYTREAIDAMRERDRAGNAVTAEDAELEAVIRRYRDASAAVGAVGGASGACPACGPRPEPDAAFCSGCGRSLVRACPACTAPISASDARFCSDCGYALSSAVRVAATAP